MTTLLDKTGKPAAVLYNNKIISLDRLDVVAIVLGSCVFGRGGFVKGKLFNKTLYAVTGEIIATEQELKTTQLEQLDHIQSMYQGWAIIEKIQDHHCPWIEPLEKWSHVNIDTFLTQAGSVRTLSTFKAQPFPSL